MPTELARTCIVVVAVSGVLWTAGEPRSARAAVCDICPQCRTFYVRTCPAAAPLECNDANDGTSPLHAWATLGHAADVINGNGSPGDVVIVGPGVYAEGNVDLKLSGNASRPIMFLGDPGGTCIGDAPGRVEVDAQQQFDTGFLVFGASYVVVAGFDLTGGRIAGIQVRPGPLGALSAGAVLANNRIFGNGQFCSSPCVNKGRGIEVMAATDTTIFNNLVYGNASVGIAIGDAGSAAAANQDSTNARVINNTIDGHDFGIIVGRGTGAVAPGAWVINNIIADVRRFGINVDGTSRCDYIGAFNLFAGSGIVPYTKTTPFDPSDIIVPDAGFAAPDNDDFRLTATSPALDAGSAPAALFGLDGSTARVDGVLDSGTVDLGFHSDAVGIPAFSSVPIVQQVLYVRANGNDAHDGLSPSQAVRTMDMAIKKARAVSSIVVGPGTYQETVALNILHPAGPVEFHADGTGQLTGDPAGRVLIDAGGGSDGINLTQRCSALIDGFAVTNAQGNGIFIKDAPRSIIRNNITFSNGSLGIQVVDSDDVLVLNNLAYANGSKASHIGGGIQIGGGVGSERVVLENNTAYGNGANGIQVGNAHNASFQAQVRYNIMADNGKNGLQLNNNSNAGTSAEGLCVEYNINIDPYGPINPANCDACLNASQPRGPCTTPPCVKTQGGCMLLPAGDLRIDPRLVNPAGSDGCLGGRHFWDDDFHLAKTSPGIDFSMQAAETLGMDVRTTQVDNTLDTGPVDSGFHYLPVTPTDIPALAGDCDGNRCVTVDELIRGVLIALDALPVENCAAFDLDHDGRVTVDELVRAVGDAFCCSR